MCSVALNECETWTIGKEEKWQIKHSKCGVTEDL